MTRRTRKLIDARAMSLQAVMARRKLVQADPDHGAALFLRGVASLMDSGHVRSLTADDLRELADMTRHYDPARDDRDVATT